MCEQRLYLDQPERLTFSSSRIVNANGEGRLEVTFSEMSEMRAWGSRSSSDKNITFMRDIDELDKELSTINLAIDAIEKT